MLALQHGVSPRVTPGTFPPAPESKNSHSPANPMPHPSPSKHTVFSFFSGAGFLDLGFEAAGLIEVESAIENSALS
jgi:hypothetical protein